MKKTIGIVLCFCMLLSLSAFAAEGRVAVGPRLSFNGTTATCEVTITAYTCDIDATVELWCGRTLIGSWHQTGQNAIVLTKKCEVESGKSYTLTVNGTIDGKSFDEVSTTKKCP